MTDATTAYLLGWVLAGLGMFVHIVGGLIGAWPVGEPNATWWAALVGFGVMWGVTTGVLFWGSDT